MIDIPQTIELSTPTTEKQPVASSDSSFVAAPKMDKYGRAWGTGRRKNSVARVWIKPGKAGMKVNGKSLADYFKRPVLQMIVNQVIEVTQSENRYEIICTVKGGGLSGQAGAIRLGLARALKNFNPESNHRILRAQGFLTRDSRVVERKKYGKRKARKSPQFSKR